MQDHDTWTMDGIKGFHDNGYESDFDFSKDYTHDDDEICTYVNIAYILKHHMQRVVSSLTSRAQAQESHLLIQSPR